jgi:hypothetical protein
MGVVEEMRRQVIEGGEQGVRDSATSL